MLVSYFVRISFRSVSCRRDGCGGPASLIEECRTSASATKSLNKIPPPPLSSWKARGPFPKLRGCFQVTIPCHCENVSKRQRSSHASGEPLLPRPSAGDRLKRPRALAGLQVKTITSERRGWREHRRAETRTTLRQSSEISAPTTDPGSHAAGKQAAGSCHAKPGILILIRSQTLLISLRVWVHLCVCVHWYFANKPRKKPHRVNPLRKVSSGSVSGLVPILVQN